jgi:peptidoglycan/LPS O-acetylase OafA/YrhL
MEYRREIDGLRALAVLPVIWFHAGISAFGGGFVGVDVFFVISGYLITSVLLAELEQGTLTLPGFYERRGGRRIAERRGRWGEVTYPECAYGFSNGRAL